MAALRAQAEAFEHVITANTTSAPLQRACASGMARRRERRRRRGRGAWPRRLGRPRAHSRQGVPRRQPGSTAVARICAQDGPARRRRSAGRARARRPRVVRRTATMARRLARCRWATLRPLRRAPYRGPRVSRDQAGVACSIARGPEDPRWLDAGAVWPALERAIDAHAATLAAVIEEPVLQAAGEMRLYSPDLLLRYGCGQADARGVYLIADEIAAGMGRTGRDAGEPTSPREPGRVSRAALPDFADALEGADGRRACRCRPCSRRTPSRSSSRPSGPRAAPSCTRTPTRATPSPSPSRAPCSTVFAGQDVLGRVAVEGPRCCAALRRARGAAAGPALRGRAGCGCRWSPPSICAGPAGAPHSIPRGAPRCAASTARPFAGASCCARSATRCTSSRRSATRRMTCPRSSPCAEAASVETVLAAA